MVALLVARDVSLAEAWAHRLSADGIASSITVPAEVGLAVRRVAPSALVAVEPATLDEIRNWAERARASAGSRVHLIAILASNSPWLRAALPDDLQPVTVLRADPPGDLTHTLRTLAADPVVAAPASGSLRLVLPARTLVGPAGEAALTASEATLLSTLLGRPGEVVPTSEAAQALWGTSRVGKHERGAIRAHLYTLRRKLAAVGAADAVRSLPGVGYRLDLP